MLELAAFPVERARHDLAPPATAGIASFPADEPAAMKARQIRLASVSSDAAHRIALTKLCFDLPIKILWNWKAIGGSVQARGFDQAGERGVLAREFCVGIKVRRERIAGRAGRVEQAKVGHWLMESICS